MLHLLLILIYRFGSHIVLPGIDPIKIDLAAVQSRWYARFVDAFAGGAFSQASIFALGYHALYLRFDLYAVDDHPGSSDAKIQKEGESGRKKINQWTRYLTVIVTAFRLLLMLLI